MLFFMCLGVEGPGQLLEDRHEGVKVSLGVFGVQLSTRHRLVRYFRLLCFFLQVRRGDIFGSTVQIYRRLFLYVFFFPDGVYLV